MNTPASETVSVVVEREMPWPPAKVWKALTQPHLIQEWLMKTDFEPAAGRAFQFVADWGSVDCQVLEIEPPRTLTYSWTAFQVRTVVSWTLTPTDTGTHLRVEQAGFLAAPEYSRFVQGAQHGWTGFLAKLEEVLSGDI
jgi:uncharacterized protein YndB with AHSA1/START domain